MIANLRKRELEIKRGGKGEIWRGLDECIVFILLYAFPFAPFGAIAAHRDEEEEEGGEEGYSRNDLLFD